MNSFCWWTQLCNRLHVPPKAQRLYDSCPARHAKATAATAKWHHFAHGDAKVIWRRTQRLPAFWMGDSKMCWKKPGSILAADSRENAVWRRGCHEAKLPAVLKITFAGLSSSSTLESSKFAFAVGGCASEAETEINFVLLQQNVMMSWECLKRFERGVLWDLKNSKDQLQCFSWRDCKRQADPGTIVLPTSRYCTSSVKGS